MYFLSAGRLICLLLLIAGILQANNTLYGLLHFVVLAGGKKALIETSYMRKTTLQTISSTARAYHRS